MKQDLKCYFGLHKYEVFKEEPIMNYKGETVGKAIINRCSNCGKIKVVNIKTVESYTR